MVASQRNHCVAPAVCLFFVSELIAIAIKKSINSFFLLDLVRFRSVFSGLIKQLSIKIRENLLKFDLRMYIWKFRRCFEFFG